MEDIIKQSLRKQFFRYKIIQLDNESLQNLEEMILFDIIIMTIVDETPGLTFEKMSKNHRNVE